MSSTQKVTLLNIGSGPRVVINSKNRQVKIDVGEQKSVELSSIIVKQFRRLASKETLRIVDETIDITPMMRHTIHLLREFYSLPEDVLIREATTILGANAFPLRPSRHHLHELLIKQLKSIIPERLSVGDVLQNDPPSPNPEPEKIVKELDVKKASEIPAFLSKPDYAKVKQPKIKVR